MCLVSAVYNSNLQLQKLGFLLLYSNYVIYYKPDLKKQMVYLLCCVFYFFFLFIYFFFAVKERMA